MTWRGFARSTAPPLCNTPNWHRSCLYRGTWFVTQADQDLDLVTNITDNDVNAALKTPLYETKRITVFFDGNVRPVEIDKNMKGLL